MSNAAGQLPDGFHFLRLPQLIECHSQLGSHLAFLCDVATAAIKFARLRHRGPGKPAIFAVGAPVAIFEVPHAIGARHLLETDTGLFDIVRMNQIKNRSIEDGRRIPAKGRLPSWIRTLKIALGVEDAEQVATHFPEATAIYRLVTHQCTHGDI